MKEVELGKKREQLLDKNTTLATLPNTTVNTLQLEPTDDDPEGAELRPGVGESPDDVIGDIMSLNEEVEAMDEEVTLARTQLRKLSDILTHAQYEDIGEENEGETAANIATKLSSDYSHFKNVVGKLHEIVQSLEGLRRKRGCSDTPLPYMMQLPPLRTAVNEGVGQGAWLHTLPDRLTGKTNCEMRLEECLLQEMIKYAEQLNQRYSSNGVKWCVTKELKYVLRIC